MDRRKFMQRAGAVALATPFLSCTGGSGETSPAAATSVPSGTSAMDRIGASTVNFRSRFPATRTMRTEPNPGPANLNLENVGDFMLSEMGIQNIEVWTQHFDDLSLAYCERVRAETERVGSRIINIQTGINPSHRDPEAQAQAVQEAREWMNRAVAIGAPAVRINPGGGEEPFDLDVAVDGYMRMLEHAAERDVMILTENHGQYGSTTDNVMAILETIDHPNFGAIIDYGNTGQDTTEGVLAHISRMFPYVDLVSAKGLTFDDEYRHLDYDYAALVRATEESGFRGIYSLELWPSPEGDPPADPVLATLALRDLTLANLV